jgi:hypothetical protein
VCSDATRLADGADAREASDDEQPSAMRPPSRMCVPMVS